jgi:hypothetical protein
LSKISWNYRFCSTFPFALILPIPPTYYASVPFVYALHFWFTAASSSSIIVPIKFFQAPTNHDKINRLLLVYLYCSYSISLSLCSRNKASLQKWISLTYSLFIYRSTSIRQNQWERYHTSFYYKQDYRVWCLCRPYGIRDMYLLSFSIYCGGRIWFHSHRINRENIIRPCTAPSRTRYYLNSTPNQICHWYKATDRRLGSLPT